MINTKSFIRIACVAVIIGIGSDLQAQEYPDVWSLSDCIDYAMKENISIRKSRINAESSRVDVKTAKAALFPTLSFSSSHNLVNRPLTEEGNVKTNSYNGNYGLNASLTLYKGGRNVKTISQQELNNRIAELNAYQTENDIEVAVIQLYMQILYAAESVTINENTVKVSEAQVNRAKELLAAGSIAQSDYAQLESQYSNDKYLLVNAQASLQDYKLQLKQLLELDDEEEMQLLLPDFNEENVLVLLPSKTDVYNAALAFRPEIEAGKLNIRASEIGVDIARAGYMPTLSLSAGAGTSHTSGSDFTFGEQVKNGWNNSVGLTLSVPIFNNRQTKSSVEKAKFQQSTAKLDLLGEEKSLFKTIESVWLDATTAQQRYVATKDKLRSSQISYDLVHEQFNIGMKNTVELLTEKNNLLSAKQEMIQAKYTAVLNIQLLHFYQGEKIEIR